jgi:hypothetical protein
VNSPILAGVTGNSAEPGYSGDNGPAPSAHIQCAPYSGGDLAIDSNGTLFFADPVDNRVRKVSKVSTQYSQ